jgi:prolipoprotein diacylglyceryltransferase
LILILVSLIGSRAGFVIRNLDYFLIYPGKIPQFWLGGLTWSGALMGAVVALIGIHLIWKNPLGDLLDSYLPLIGAVSTAIWITSWWTGTGYGPETSAWFGISVQDMFGITAARWPFPVLGALLSAGWIAAAIFFPFKRGQKAGLRGLMGLVGLLAIELIFSFFMADPAPLWWGLRRESWIVMIMILLAAGGIYFLGKKDERGRT